MAAVYRLLLLVVAVLLAAPAAFCNEKPLVLGVFPYITPGKLMQQHAVLRSYVERTLGQPVEIVTAPNFDDFVARTRNGDYDIVLTAPHLGRLAQVRDGYIPLAFTAHHVVAVFLARNDSGIRSLSDLRGKTIVIAEPTSIVAQLALATLRRAGIEPGKDIIIRASSAHNNALSAPARREADASVTGIVLWQKAEPQIRDHLVEIGTSEPAPGFIVLANPRMPEGQVDRLRAALLGFADTAEGRAYFNSTGFKGLMRVSPSVLKEMDPYIKVFLDRK